MNKETILDVIGTCMIAAGSAGIGAIVGAYVEHKESKTFNKKLMHYLTLNNAVINSMKELVVLNSNCITKLESKMFDLQSKLNNVE